MSRYSIDNMSTTLENLCSLISRGYNIPASNIESNAILGRKIALIGFKDITETTITANKIVNLKKDNLVEKYRMSPYDVLLPLSINETLNIKNAYQPLLCQKDKLDFKLNPIVYSQNIIILRFTYEALETTSNSDGVPTLFNLLSSETILKRLASEVYSGEKTKTISIDKLKAFRIPLPNSDTFKKLLAECGKSYQELHQRQYALDNYIAEMYQKIDDISS